MKGTQSAEILCLENADGFKLLATGSIEKSGNMWRITASNKHLAYILSRQWPA